MTSVRVRPAGSDDRTAFIEVTDGFAEPSIKNLVGETSRSLVAETLDGNVVGSLEARCAGGDIEIIMLATRPSARRQGIASQLLDALVTRAATDNASRIILDVAADNTAARALYTANSFTEIARRPGYYRSGRSGEACDALLLERKLECGAAA